MKACGREACLHGRGAEGRGGLRPCIALAVSREGSGGLRVWDEAVCGSGWFGSGGWVREGALVIASFVTVGRNRLKEARGDLRFIRHICDTVEASHWDFSPVAQGGSIRFVWVSYYLPFSRP